jgi:wyosine [tRNA(Phe)-imidazoG37] synthetase (radical SAM superfamily)
VDGSRPRRYDARGEGERSTSYVFGPVPSRRLGQSLGIDPVPFKTCNWNCVYCQLGRTTPLTNERREYVPPETLLAEVRAALDAHEGGGIDWVTFVGSGETTLHSGLGRMIRAVKEKTPLPVAVITNGSLLDLEEVREELLSADAVLPTLDAGNESLYRAINRPWPGLTLERLVRGLIAFREIYQGKLWVEVMLVKGMNDSETVLREIAGHLERIRPDEIHINLPSRPPAESWVEPPDAEGLMRARAILGSRASVVVEPHGEFDLGGYDDLTEALLAVLTRHPMAEEDLVATLKRWSRGDVERALAELRASGGAGIVTRYGKRFWSASAARYGETARRPQERHRGLGAEDDRGV